MLGILFGCIVYIELIKSFVHYPYSVLETLVTFRATRLVSPPLSKQVHCPLTPRSRITCPLEPRYSDCPLKPRPLEPRNRQQYTVREYASVQFTGCGGHFTEIAVLSALARRRYTLLFHYCRKFLAHKLCYTRFLKVILSTQCSKSSFLLQVYLITVKHMGNGYVSGILEISNYILYYSVCFYIQPNHNKPPNSDRNRFYYLSIFGLEAFFIFSICLSFHYWFKNPTWFHNNTFY